MSNIVPDNYIALISYSKELQTDENISKLFSSLKGSLKRDWFIKHAYYCLPLVMGNQHGFVLRSIYDVEVIWNGGDSPNDVTVHHKDKDFYEKNLALQSIKSHFGMGTITVQTAFSLRTPNGINLMTINPPNYYIDGLYHMTGVVETDNLRRDFTYNLRLTRPNFTVKINKGNIIGCVLPYPRHFIDNFQLINAENILSSEIIEEERKCANDLGKERAEIDKYKKNGNGRRYFKGEDVYGNKFIDHQITLDK
jgi:hypothetical protein